MILGLMLAAAMAASPDVAVHTTFQNPPMPPMAVGYYIEAYERHDTGATVYAVPRITAPAATWYWLTFEGDSWQIWTDYPALGQVIYLCVASYNGAGQSECVTQEVF